jgi:hypothetical protein
MAGSSDANDVPKGTTLVFGSWACTADGSGGFSNHLVTPNSPKPKTTTHLADICKTADLDEKRVLLELGSGKVENVSTPTRAFELAESNTNSDTEKNSLFRNPRKILDSSQDDQTPQDQKLKTTQWSRSSFTINRGMHQTRRICHWLIYITAEPRSIKPTTETVG